MLTEILEPQINQLKKDHLYRQKFVVETPTGVFIHVNNLDYLSFCSNDYLGLANHNDLIQAFKNGADEFGVGAGASHLVAGHQSLHDKLEIELANFIQLPKSLLFSTGYMANLGIITALVGRNDSVFSDKLNHASLNDGIVLSRASLNRYRHNDLQQLEILLQKDLEKNPKATRLIITDAVFSMDGDIADIPNLLKLAQKYKALLMLDDAHGFGVLGTNGRGSLEHFNIDLSDENVREHLIYMATLGKAGGVFGAFVAGQEILINYLIQKARTYIFTTAMPSALASALSASLKVIQQNQHLRTHLSNLISYLRSNLTSRILNQNESKHWYLMNSETAIQPLVIGSNEETVKVSEFLKQKGIWVPAIRPPTVPKGEARLRISLSAQHSIGDIELLISTLSSYLSSKTS